jgi:indolepyruvate ferredoxin oxidoreductase alpha subunit
MGCLDCLDLGCPALSVSGDKALIDAAMCVGTACGVCAQLCPQEAISEIKR